VKSKGQGEMDLNQFIEALPKAEMHLHVEGTVPWTQVEAYASLGEAPPDWLHPDYRFADFSDFSEIMRPGTAYIRTSAANYKATAAAYFAQLMKQNVRYVEISIGMGLALLNAKNDPAEVVAAIRDAIPPGLHVRVIAGINRRYVHPMDSEETRAILNTPGIDGIDLQSDERTSGPCMFLDIYRAAEERGYLLRAHAGELAGPAAIRETLDCLHVTRIEHGVTAIQDEDLIERLVKENITLDMCPTSNVKLCIVESLAAHPIGELLRRGVKVTCSTDDPAVLGVSLTDELRNLVTYQNFTAHELAALQINAFEVALLPDDVRQSLIAEVQALTERFVRKAENNAASASEND
jgi:adenosine deaminase